MRRIRTAFVLACTTVGATMAGSPPLLARQVAAPPDAPTVVYFVRHAERAENGTNDPAISAEGHARARLLAEMLKDAGITHVHTTDYQRTRETAAPAAAGAGVAVEVYDPRDLTGLADRIRATPGRHLVVGHSNTTPDAVAALGGDPGGPIDEAEYDRFYVVVLPDGGTPATVLLRFGTPHG